MGKTFTRIAIWIGIMAGLTVLAIGIWYIGWRGIQTTESLKWLQLLQTTGTFLLPPILCAWMWDANHQPFRWLKTDTIANWRVIVIAVAIMVCAIPGINLLADLNSRIELPESLDFIEQILKQQEEAAAALTERFLQADNIGQLLINVGLLALLPALAEEFSFRGTLQQILYSNQQSVVSCQPHIAIWVTAFVFSAIHMQFYGFVPRMLMGALFGYMFVWTGCLWVPVIMHFTNNGIAVIAHYVEHSVVSSQQSDTNIADTIGAGDTWWIGVISLIAVGALIYGLLTIQGQRGYVRRIHTR